MRNPANKYRDWHWGHKPTHTKRVPIAGLAADDPVVECGLLTELHIDPRDDLPLPQERGASMDDAAHFEGHEPDVFSVLRVQKRDYNNNHLVFDPQHPHQRLYPVLSPSTQRDAATLWDPSKRPTTLRKLAAKAGGHHAADDYPRIPVQELGTLYFVTYYTHKKGDDPASKYIHRMGEEGGVDPILAVAEDGTLWICGGSYTCPDDGITQ